MRRRRRREAVVRMHRAWRRLPDEAREPLLEEMSPSELRTVLLEVVRSRAELVTPAEVVRRWQDDPLVRPAPTDPRRVVRIEAELWRLLPDDVVGIELSPVAPLGTCVAVTSGSEDRIVATTRGTEVVSDPTNALAVEAAVRRREQAPDGEVHLAACSSVLRAQPYDGAASQHFRLFALVSAARDTGSHRTEARLLLRHVRYWQAVLGELAPANEPRVEVSGFDAVMTERLGDTVLPASSPEVPVVSVPDRERGRGYYTAAGLRLALDRGASEIGDGGITTWTADLLGNAKERCLVSVLATQRLTDAVLPG
jgi:hypothetical protein